MFYYIGVQPITHIPTVFVSFLSDLLILMSHASSDITQFRGRTKLLTSLLDTVIKITAFIIDQTVPKHMGAVRY